MYTLNIFVKFCLSLVPIAVVVAFGFMQFDDFCTLFLFAANACCYFGNYNLDQIEQGSGMKKKHFFSIRSIFCLYFLLLSGLPRNVPN